MVRKKPRTLQEKQKHAAKVKCIHYWIIESPHGPTSIGVCKLCGATSKFQNYLPFPSWEGKVTKLPEGDELSDIEQDEELNNS